MVLKRLLQLVRPVLSGLYPNSGQATINVGRHLAAVSLD